MALERKVCANGHKSASENCNSYLWTEETWSDFLSGKKKKVFVFAEGYVHFLQVHKKYWYPVYYTQRACLT